MWCASRHPRADHRRDFRREGAPPAGERPLSREEKSVHNHHRKKIIWRTFLASKRNFPGRWWVQKPYKSQENHIHHRNLSSVDPIFFCKEKFCTGAGRCMVFFFPAFPATILPVLGRTPVLGSSRANCHHRDLLTSL